MTTRIICRATDCIFNEKKICTAEEILYEPDDGCMTYQIVDDLVDDADDDLEADDELLEDDDLEWDEDEEDEDLFLEDDLDEEDEDDEELELDLAEDDDWSF